MPLLQLELLSFQPLTRPRDGRNSLPGHGAEGIDQGDPCGEWQFARWSPYADNSSPLDIGHESLREDPSESLTHRRLPGGEDVGCEVPEQRRVARANKRHLSLPQAEEHHFDPWPRDEVGRSEAVHHGWFEPGFEEHGDQRLLWRSHEPGCRLTLHPQISIDWWRGAAGQFADNRRGDVERDIGEHFVGGQREWEAQEVAGEEGDVGGVCELDPELLCQVWVLFHRQHLPATRGQPLGDDAAAGSDLDDQIIGADPGAIQKTLDKLRTAQEVLRIGDAVMTKLGHGILPTR